MQGLVVVFAGATSSGKSAVSKALAARLSWPRVAFGDYVRGIAAERGMSGSREALQDLGEALIMEMGWPGFCRAVVAQSVPPDPEDLLVDGIRHREGFETLRMLLAPRRVVLVFLELDAKERQSRGIAARDGGPASLVQQDAHSTEIQVTSGQLRIAADRVLDASRSVEELADDLINWITRTLRNQSA